MNAVDNLSTVPSNRPCGVTRPLLFYIAHRDRTEQHSGQESQALRIEPGRETQVR